MLTSKRSILRTLAAALEATKQSYQTPSRGYRHQLSKEEHYQQHLLLVLRTVMAGMAKALCDNDADAAAKLLDSVAKKA